MGQNFPVDANALVLSLMLAKLPHNRWLSKSARVGGVDMELVQRAGAVILIELDKRLIARLYEEFAAFTNLTLVNHDILKSDIAQITARRPYRVVANLPYAITSPVLRHFLESDHPPELMVVLVQREVAQRICAAPGDMSVLAHAMQICAVPELVAIVPPNPLCRRRQSILPYCVCATAPYHSWRRRTNAKSCGSSKRVFYMPANN
jgi:16S rRNA (adenine1518-N6/adenine1519-N6)-dimethyltransferase